ncbi:DUF533 domain-containing protein [Mesobaculum littorinae]|uniref:DUF533 domain-containing protein n=1 Tax=Mesobaculum littorinae TaxID=2486419 RepID=A0A438AIE0_9RHOB|nr:DUF533 domain-containing protein [Mesobaculum littorinae]RVV98414.1 DUF533 domain-containing protein [Mesobaculum littorinae]
MSLKRILGTMLANKLAGRGRRRGSLGPAAMLGGGGYRRGPRRGGKLGLAAMGYMAYQAYRDQQARDTSRGGQGREANGAPGTRSASTSGATRRGSRSGGLQGMVEDVVARVSGALDQGNHGGPADPDPAEMQADAQAADSFSDSTALLLIRAMITAAYSDGALSLEERHRIMGEIDAAGGDAEDRRIMEREIAHPQPLDTLLAEIRDQETAEEFYLASRAAVDGETEANRAYLTLLRERLSLTQAQVEEIDAIA